MLTFVGLGLHNERSITVRGRDAIREADHVVAEFYTSRLTGTTVEELGAFHDTEITVLDRADVEVHPDEFLDDAQQDDVVFLTGGDPMVSTTHVDLRLRAIERGIETHVIHGPSIETAAAGRTGLQNYRFGKATTIPFPGTFSGDGPPQSVVDTVTDNLERGLHTLLYLDLDEAGEDSLSASDAAALLSGEFGDRLGVVVAGAGSESPTVAADRVETLAAKSFGPALHVLILPGSLHPMEVDALQALADAPAELTEQYANDV